MYRRKSVRQQNKIIQNFPRSKWTRLIYILSLFIFAMVFGMAVRFAITQYFSSQGTSSAGQNPSSNAPIKNRL